MTYAQILAGAIKHVVLDSFQQYKFIGVLYKVI